MRSFISSVLVCALLICHQGYASIYHDDISDCLADLDFDVSVFGIPVIKDIKPSSYRYLFSSSLDVNKRNCLAACMFQKAGIINSEGRFSGESIPKLYRDRPDTKVTACKDVQEFCEVGGCLLEAIYSQDLNLV